MNDQIEIDLEINDGQVDIDLEVDTGVPNYLAMRLNYTLEKLTDATIGYAEIIPKYAFAYCNGLKTADVYNVAKLDDYAFYHCESISKINLPNVTYIGMYSLAYIAQESQIEEMRFDNVVGEYDLLSYAFYDSNIRKIVMPKANYLDGSPFNKCNAEELVLPAQTKAINFSGMPNINTLYLPAAESSKSESKNGTRSFSTIASSCESLINVVLPNITSAGYTLFQSCKSLLNIYVPRLLKIGVGANNSTTLLYSCESVKTLSLPSLRYINVTEDNDYRYTYSYSATIANSCASLERVYLPNLEQAAFNDAIRTCPNLNGLFMPSLIRRYSNSDTNCLLYSNYNNDFTLYTPSCSDWRGYINYNSSSFKCPNFWWVIGKETDSEPCLLRSQLWGTYKPTNINIYVPDHLVDAYKTATNWSLYATYIKPQSEMPQELIDRIEAEMIPPEDPDFEAMGINIEEATA